MAFPIVLVGGPPWGFKVDGGIDLETPIRISTVVEGGKAVDQGLRVGDLIERINGESTALLTNSGARHLIRQADSTLVLFLLRQSLVIPEIRVISPVSGEILSGSDNLNQQPCYAPPYAAAGRLEHQLSSATVHQESLPFVVAARQEGFLDSSDIEGSRSEEDCSGSTSDSTNSVINMSMTTSGPKTDARRGWGQGWDGIKDGSGAVSFTGNDIVNRSMVQGDSRRGSDSGTEGNPNSSNSTKSYKSVRFSPGLTGSPTPPRINSDNNGQMSSGVNQNQTPDYMPEDNETYTFTVFNAATRSFNESTNPGIRNQPLPGKPEAANFVKPPASLPPGAAASTTRQNNNYTFTQNVVARPEFERIASPPTRNTNTNTAHSGFPSVISGDNRSGVMSPGCNRSGVMSPVCTVNNADILTSTFSPSYQAEPLVIRKSEDQKKPPQVLPKPVLRNKQDERNEQDEMLMTEDWWNAFLKTTVDSPVHNLPTRPTFVPPPRTFTLPSSVDTVSARPQSVMAVAPIAGSVNTTSNNSSSSRENYTFSVPVTAGVPVGSFPGRAATLPSCPSNNDTGDSTPLLEGTRRYSDDQFKVQTQGSLKAMLAQAPSLDNKKLLQEWKSGRNDEHQSGRRSVDFYKQLNDSHQNSPSGFVQNSETFSGERQEQNNVLLEKLLQNQQFKSQPIVSREELFQNQQFKYQPIASREELLQNQQFKSQPIVSREELLQNQQFKSQPIVSREELFQNEQFKSQPIVSREELLQNQQFKSQPIVSREQLLQNQQFKSQPIGSREEFVQNQQFRSQPIKFEELFEPECMKREQVKPSKSLPVNTELGTREEPFKLQPVFRQEQKKLEEPLQIKPSVNYTEPLRVVPKEQVFDYPRKFSADMPNRIDGKAGKPVKLESPIRNEANVYYAVRSSDAHMQELLGYPQKFASEVDRGMDGTAGRRVVYKGVDPSDESTGILMATGNSIEDKSRKDWYRQMYSAIHKQDVPPERRKSDQRDGTGSICSERSASITIIDSNPENLYPPHASYKKHEYRNQPMRIEDYQPGRHSSIAIQHARRIMGNVPHESSNSYAESDTETSYRSNKFDRAPSPTHSDMGDVIQRQKSRAKGTRYVMNGQSSRERWDEENLKRKIEIENVIAEERRRRFMHEQKDSQARRHTDTLTPMQKSSIMLNRYNDELAETLKRPDRKVHTKVKGRVKALHKFRAQSYNELSFKRGDILFLLKQIDKNWYKGEHHGIQGIFPVSYVQVLVSLEDARAAAVSKEGQAYVSYNFNAQSHSELSLRKGDIVTLIRRVDSNWYEGRIGNRQGIFPVTYVESRREPETPMTTPMSSHPATPVPGTPSRLSPASSICSVTGPDIPSAPMSPWDSDFYDTDCESESHSRRTPVNFDSSRPRSNSQTPVNFDSFRPQSDRQTPVNYDLSRPRSDRLTPVNYDSSRPRSNSQTPVNFDPYLRPTDRQTPVHFSSSHQWSDQQKPVNFDPYHPGSNCQTPVHFDSSRSPSARQTPVNYDSSGRSTPKNQYADHPLFTEYANQALLAVPPHKHTPLRSESPGLYSPSNPLTLPRYQDTNQDKELLDRSHTDAYSASIRGRSAQSSHDAFLRRLSLDRSIAPGSRPVTPSVDNTARTTSRVEYKDGNSEFKTQNGFGGSSHFSPRSNFDLGERELPEHDVVRDTRGQIGQTKGPVMQEQYRGRSITPTLTYQDRGRSSALPESTSYQTGNSQILSQPIQHERETSGSMSARSYQTRNNSLPDPTYNARDRIAPKVGATVQHARNISTAKLDPVRSPSRNNRTPTPESKQNVTRNNRTPTPDDPPGGNVVPNKNFLSKPPRSSSHPRYRAIYTYKPRNSDELELTAGDIVCVVEKCDDGWYVGYAEKSNKFGTFPGNYIKKF